MRKALVALSLAVLLVGCSATDASAKVREPHTGPLRVLLVGDSITVSYQDRVAQLLPGMSVTGAGIGSTGLLDVDMCSGARAKNLIATYDPDVVVVEYVGNYARSGPVCATVTQASAGFYARWKASARRTGRRLAAKGARVLWTLIPTNARPVYTGMVGPLNAIYRTLGENVDAYTAFGAYDPALHVPDGLHLSPAGVERMAQTVAARVRG